VLITFGELLYCRMARRSCSPSSCRDSRKARRGKEGVSKVTAPSRSTQPGSRSALHEEVKCTANISDNAPPIE